MHQHAIVDQTTAITNAKVFDGENILADSTVVIKGANIQAVDGAVPSGATVIDGRCPRPYQHGWFARCSEIWGDHRAGNEWALVGQTAQRHRAAQ